MAIRITPWLTAAVLALLLAFGASTATLAQGAPQTAQVEQPKPEPKKEPGFFESIGRWFERGYASLKGSFSDAKTNMDNLGDKAVDVSKNIGEKAAQAGKSAAEATKGAVEAMKRLPSTRVIQGNERCDISPNGAPDCRAAALLICTSKGFSSGTSVDFVSAEKCPPTIWAQRRRPEPGECVTETFVTRAMCQ